MESKKGKNSQSCFFRSSIIIIFFLFYFVIIFSLSVCPSSSVCLSVCLSACLPACLSIYLSIYLSICISIHPSFHPSTHTPILKALFEYQKPAALLSTFNCCGLSANLYIHWLKTQAIVYELLYFDEFEGSDKWVGQLLKDLKNDNEFHYVTFKSKTLICHFNQNTHVRQSIHPPLLGTKWPKWVRIDQKVYEMTWVRTDHHIVISYPTDLGTKWPKWVRNDLGTEWLLLGMKWPKRRYEMTKVDTKWPGCEMTWVRNDWQPTCLSSFYGFSCFCSSS